MRTIATDTSRTVLSLIGALAMTGLLFADPLSAHDRQAPFEGVSIGAQAGWEKRDIDEQIPVAPASIRLTDDADSAIFGGFVGYDHQFDTMVLGIEAGVAINGGTLRTDVAGAGAIEVDSRWAADLSLRAGFTPVENVLLYGRGGYALNRNRTRAFAAGQPQPVASGSATDDGWLYGGGVEIALPRGLSIRAEYRRTEFDGSLASDQVLGGVALRF
ncbi:outer membrane protein [Parasphingorhabdus sp.]|uniref:outer membrane protein n=1 Tax=Parasphingorhabdus sp. TaxID=2709688 RepID=UPI003A94CFF7